MRADTAVQAALGIFDRRIAGRVNPNPRLWDSECDECHQPGLVLTEYETRYGNTTGEIFCHAHAVEFIPRHLAAADLADELVIVLPALTDQLAA